MPPGEVNGVLGPGERKGVGLGMTSKETRGLEMRELDLRDHKEGVSTQRQLSPLHHHYQGAS